PSRGFSRDSTDRRRFSCYNRNRRPTATPSRRVARRSTPAGVSAASNTEPLTKPLTRSEPERPRASGHSRAAAARAATRVRLAPSISAAIPRWAETVRGATRPAARQVTTSVRIVPPASGLFHLQPDPAVGDGILTLHDPVVAGVRRSHHGVLDGVSDQLVVGI